MQVLRVDRYELGQGASLRAVRDAHGFRARMITGVIASGVALAVSTSWMARAMQDKGFVEGLLSSPIPFFIVFLLLVPLLGWLYVACYRDEFRLDESGARIRAKRPFSAARERRIPRASFGGIRVRAEKRLALSLQYYPPWPWLILPIRVWILELEPVAGADLCVELFATRDPEAARARARELSAHLGLPVEESLAEGELRPPDALWTWWRGGAEGLFHLSILVGLPLACAAVYSPGPAACAENRATALAVDAGAGHLYWMDPYLGAIQRADAQGRGVQPWIYFEEPSFGDMAVDPVGNKIYWSEVKNETLRRANLDGSELEVLAVDHLGMFVSVDAKRGWLYWIEPVEADKRLHFELWRSRLDGSDARSLDWKAPREQIKDFAVDPETGDLYWIAKFEEWWSILRAPASLTEWEHFVSGESRGSEWWPTSLAVSGGALYWSDDWNETIERASTADSEVAAVAEITWLGAVDLAVNADAQRVHWSDGCRVDGAPLPPTRSATLQR